MRLVTVATAIGGILAATLAFGAASKQATAAQAWCAVNASGGVLFNQSFRCLPAETQRLGVGTYEVDFTPLSDDISTFPRSAQIDTLAFGVGPAGMVGTSNRFDDASSIFVRTYDQNGNPFDTSFFLVIE